MPRPRVRDVGNTLIAGLEKGGFLQRIEICVNGRRDPNAFNGQSLRRVGAVKDYSDLLMEQCPVSDSRAIQSSHRSSFALSAECASACESTAIDPGIDEFGPQLPW